MPLLRADLQDIPPYRRPDEPRGLVRLHMNEAAEDWPSPAREALLARLGALPFHQYPERQEELTERLGRRCGAPPGGLLLGPSSGALLDLVALAGLSPGDAVAVPEPGFSLYPLLVKRHRGLLRPVPVGTGFPLAPWFEALDCRQLWITLPNNPTGAWVDPEALEPLLEAAAARADPPLVVLDEAYAEFAPRTHRLAVDRYPNLLLLRTFSKALASASWRLGYLLGDPALLDRLAALQLPYSLSAASLEALDVALDFAPDFEAATRATVERRERLRGAIPDRAVAESAANFLHVAPDPTPALREAGLLARALGEGAARVGVGPEASAARAARALGGSLPPPRARPPRRLLVLDVDGVLIEAERSFMEAVAGAMGDLAPGLAWDDAHFRAFKRLGGFNNDFRLASAAWVLAERGRLERIFEGGPADFADLEEEFRAREPLAQRAGQRHYARTCRLERALVEKAELEATGQDLAILTGRPPEELALAFGVLGWSLPAVCDAGPHLRKPEPGGLLQLADAFRAEALTFVGDTRDDAEALRRARELRPDLAWRFGAVGPDRARFASPEDLQAPTLRDLLPMLS